jgi:hypothetical protein
MPDRHSVRHAEQKAGEDADQVEKVALRNGSAIIDTGVRDEQIAEAMEEEDYEPSMAGLDDPGDNPGRERWHRLDLGLEGGVSAIRQEIGRRGDFLKSGYPFDVDGNTLRYRGPSSGFYEYCLGISVAPNVVEGDFVQLPRSFERIVALIVQLYMGAHSDSFHTGAPRDDNLTTWYAAMQELGRRTNEWKWQPHEGLPNEPTVGGDAGMDFVVWKKSPDARPGHLFIIGQCACGGNWSGKLDELSLRVLSAWFHPMTYVEPVRAFATPFTLSDGNFQFAHKRAGWVLDRIRLVGMAEAVSGEAEYVAWRQRLEAMVNLSLSDAA